MKRWKRRGNGANDGNDRFPGGRRQRPTEIRGDERGENQARKHVDARQLVLGDDAVQCQDHNDRADAQPNRAQVEDALAEREPRVHENGLIARTLFGGADEITDLADRDEQAGPGHEAEDHRFGNVARQVAEPQCRDDDLHRAGDDAQQKQRLVPVYLARKRCEGAKDDERNRVRGSVDQMRRRPEQRCNDGYDDGGVEAVARIDAGDQRVRDRLGNRDRGDRRTGNEVAAKSR